MIYENLIICKKLVRSDSKEKIRLQQALSKNNKDKRWNKNKNLKYYFSYVSNFFHKK